MRKHGARPTFYWVIRGYDSDKEIYSEKIEATLLSAPRMRALLMCLVARAGLDFGKIVDSYVTKRTKRHATHLEVLDDVKHHTLTCGSNPHFAARLVKELPDTSRT